MGFLGIIREWEGFQFKFHFSFHFAHFRAWKVPQKFHKKANLRLNKV